MIETILLDADSWGLRFEVEIDAKKYLEEGLTDDAVEAHIWAYEDWIK
jgi:hypothetical protein